MTSYERGEGYLWQDCSSMHRRVLVRKLAIVHLESSRVCHQGPELSRDIRAVFSLSRFPRAAWLFRLDLEQRLDLYV